MPPIPSRTTLPVTPCPQNQEKPSNPTRHSTPFVLNYKNSCTATIAFDDHIDPLMFMPTFCLNTLNHNARTGDTTTNPCSLRAALQALDSNLWERSWNAEVASLEKHSTLSCISKFALTLQATLLLLKFALRLKNDKAGNVISRKMRCAARGDKHIPTSTTTLKPSRALSPTEISSVVPSTSPPVPHLLLKTGT